MSDYAAIPYERCDVCFTLHKTCRIQDSRDRVAICWGLISLESIKNSSFGPCRLLKKFFARYAESTRGWGSVSSAIFNAHQLVCQDTFNWRSGQR